MPCTVQNDQPLPAISTLEQRGRLCQYHREQLQLCNSTYNDLLSELFFLQHGGNYMDYIQFKKRPSQQLSVYLSQNPLVANDGVKRPLSTESRVSLSSIDDGTNDVSLSKKQLVCSPSDALPSNEETLSTKLKNKQSSRNVLSESFEDGIGSQEEILERAKQEAIVIRRVSELRKQGLWSQRRMPKVQEPPRNKAHWDYLLEEMRWLAADFSQERKWKRAAARKLVRMVLNYHKDEKDREKRAEREERQKLRRIASNIARQVRVFWSDIEKVVEYKQRSLLDEKRQRALDLHLNFIVDQTAKYSTWLTQGLSHPGDSKSLSPSISRSSSYAGSDDDFMPQGASTDDEETIEVEENAEQEDVMDEIALLKQESELPFSELLSQLPKDLVESLDKPLPLSPMEPEEKDLPAVSKEASAQSNSPPKESLQEENVSSDDNGKPSPISLRRSARKRHSEEDPDVDSKKQKVDEPPPQDDVEFDAGSGSSDDEATMQEQEEAENIDHKQEIEDLQNESEMPIEELMKLYGENSMSDHDVKSEEKSASSESEADEDGFSSSECEEIGMDYLLRTEAESEPKDVKAEKESSPSKEITDVAAEAMSLQPTGHTLATTQVVTPIPPLLRHTLREYQHIGLDWLVTMYDKRLNGILADEMGLGKTIQTIALLAHLACDKGIWGPHLIVVPTSVMLNWEMELKKWCPGFKILTYYGSQKERKMKRTGWTKSNAFHVCITSYKLVLQDHSSFRRKKWRYLILDEAQNIKNFKSQRWQTLLNFNSQRRLLLTGTPLQNNLMELWSLMHFLMPHVFQSHKEFKEWFANPMTGMIEGSQEFNEKLVKRLHKVLRPFLLRRIKKDVEKQMPNKYEHVVKCHLSKRQRFLYEDFMSRAATKETLAGGHFMSVINVLMQLRKVCNHPNLFEPRPILSSFAASPIEYQVPCIVYKALEKEPFEELKPEDLNLHLPTLSDLTTHDIDLLKRLKTSSRLIQEVDSADERPVAESATSFPEKIRSLIKEKLHSQYQVEGAKRYQTSNSSSEPNSTSQPNSSSTGQRATDALTPTTGADVSRASSTQSITLQYQTAHGTRWATIPNGQIRHLPGGVVQIVTSGSNSRSMTSSPSLQANNDVTEKHSQKTTAQSYSRMLAKRRATKRQEVLLRLSRMNEQRCQIESTYLPSNLIRLIESITSWKNRGKESSSAGMPSSPCQQELRSQLLSKFVTSPEDRLEEMKEILNRFIFVIPKVSSSPIQLSVSHPTPWRYYSLKRLLRQSKLWMSTQLVPYHRILQNSRVSFPEARLIEYDCGKLQILSTLLRRFWDEKHRILIFTQMTKVLDILEAFLSYHGYRYLRLDGSTPIEHRMGRMERFNNDPRIFCFILSTRSGGIGVNLTGADTVVFYDSDWNPTMDAQAQDRCHRIGQTRDVHIYRLISERTVEENILKKANQKRLLGDLAIEGGEFTTAFFKHQQIKDLFADPSGLEELTDQPKLTVRQKAIEASKAQTEEAKGGGANELERALLESEEKEDAAAAQLLREEQEAVMEEFVDADDRKDEDERGSSVKFAKGSRVEEEMKTIYEELTPVERYALNYLELSAEAANDMELEEAEMHVEQSKKEWELAHLLALKEEEERRTEEADEIFYTREGNQVFMDELTGEVMPTWYPPTPPHDDVYVDPCDFLLYSQTPMSEDSLTDIVVKKERKRPKQEPGAQLPHRKIPRVDVTVPKSLFNRQLIFKKKEKPLKLKLAKPTKTSATTGSNKNVQVAAAPGTPPAGATESSILNKPPVPNVSHPDWIVNEDWVLLQAIQQVLEMPLSLVTLMPAHTANWHLVADLVNAVGSVYRSPKECKHRFESVIAPREEGKVLLTPKKKLKNLKFPVKTKMTKCHRMNVIYTTDSNSQFSNLYSNRFDACKAICNKRNPPSKSSGSSGQFQRNPKHTNILLDCGINYDKPLHPMQVVANRVKRLANQKKNESATTIQPPQAVTLTPNIPQGVTTMAQRIGGALVVNGSPVVGKAGLQVTNQGLNQLTAIPLSVGSSSIVVNSAFARRQSQPSVQAAATKLQSGKAGGAALTLRSLSGSTQHIQIPQPISSVQSLSLTFTAQSPVVTITTAAPGVKLSAIQHIRQANQQSGQPTVTKQQVKQGVQHTMSTPPQSAAALMSVPATVVGGKKVQLTKMSRPVTHHQLELLMKQRSQIRPVSHRTPQVHIAPIQAQVQAQSIRTHAAQQASQQHSSKALPITVPVSAVSLTGLNPSSSTPQKSVVVPGGQTTLPHQLVLQQLQKHRQMSQQQQGRQPQKTVYATVPSHQLVVSGGSTTVKMTSHIQAQMISQLVAQQQQQRRASNKQGTSLVQPPVTLTVTKLLQSPVTPTIRHTLVPHNAQLAQQVTQLPLSVATSMVTPSVMATHQQGLSTQQRQQLHMARPQLRVQNSSPGVSPQMNIQISTAQPGLLVGGPPGTPVTIVPSPTSSIGDTNFNLQPRSR